LREPDKATLSVILPNYNHGRMLERAVAAMLKQDKVPDEIVIVDDDSTDDSRRILGEIASNCPAVRVLFNDANKGVVYSLNRGLQATTGRYVYLAAADDWVLPGFFATALRLLEDHPAAGLACGEVNLISGNTGESLGRRPWVRPSRRPACFPPELVAAMLRRSDNWILTGAAILARDKVVAAGALLPELGSFADGFLVRKIALMSGFCYIPEPVATWQVFETSVSRQTASDPAKARTMLSTAVAQFTADRCFPRWYSALFSRRWRFAVCRLAANATPINEAVLLEMGVRNRLDRVTISALCRYLPSGVQHPLLLVWLWLRLRPFYPLLLLSSLLSRRIERARGAG
jgi:glycosyltransferase involved in cell wall biosynthesis